ncbi:uncharacterized protein LOC116338675 [Contarinia nasturtii]|uniref:uncharacterized protein LOC116338675 n=1 Tax=Contarinia nasturtii TaxID=265458 RepID=UPI0012D3B002|nr:uncharacterized protein LOC116338675 [Contarinia nasturtii]
MFTVRGPTTRSATLAREEFESIRDEMYNIMQTVMNSGIARENDKCAFLQINNEDCIIFEWVNGLNHLLYKRVILTADMKPRIEFNGQTNDYYCYLNKRITKEELENLLLHVAFKSEEKLKKLLKCVPNAQESIIEISDDEMDGQPIPIVQPAFEIVEIYDDEIDGHTAGYDVQNMIDEISNLNAELSNFAVDHFIDVLVKKQFPNWNMQPTAYAQAIDRYKAVPIDRNDIQIILCFHPRHYIVSHYVARRNRVFIYDSLYKRGKTLNHQQIDILQRIYPGKSYQFVKPATIQPDYVSCGVFAIANVTTLLHHLDPQTYAYGDRHNDPNLARKMRQHLLYMYENETIDLFPSYTD